MEPADPPSIGVWYETDDGTLFVVVAYDAAQGSVDIQYAGGRLERLEARTWAEISAQEVESPEGWRESMDVFQARRRHEPK